MRAPARGRRGTLARSSSVSDWSLPMLARGFALRPTVVDAGNLLLQTLDDRGHVIIAIVTRLQVDLDASAVRRGIGAVNANERGKALDVFIFQNGCGQRLLTL